MQSLKEILLIESDGNPEKKSRIRKALRYATIASAVASPVLGAVALSKHKENKNLKSENKFLHTATGKYAQETSDLKGRVAQAETDRDAAEKGHKEALAANASLSQHLDAVKAENEAHKTKQAQIASSEKPLALNAKPEVAVSKNLSNKKAQPDSKQTLFSRIATAVDSKLGSY